VDWKLRQGFSDWDRVSSLRKELFHLWGTTMFAFKALTWLEEAPVLWRLIHFTQNLLMCLAWWHTPVTPAHRRLRQEDCEFETSLGYIEKPYLKKKKKVYWFKFFSHVKKKVFTAISRLTDISQKKKKKTWAPYLSQVDHKINYHKVFTTIFPHQEGAETKIQEAQLLPGIREQEFPFCM
jgi:hypothetical protein